MRDLGADAGANKREAARPGDAGRWIGSSLAGAMRRAQFTGLILVQLILAVAAVASSIAVPDVAVLPVAGVVVAAGVAVLLLRVRSLVLIVAHYAALAFYFLIVPGPNEPLLCVLIPFTAWTLLLPIMLWTGAAAGIGSGALIVAFAAVIALAHPEWDRAVLVVSVTTNIVLAVTAAWFVRYLRRAGGTADQQQRETAQEKLRAVRARAMAKANVEYTRVLHDTIVNTLGALARDDTRGMDAADVQDRCRRDLERIRAFQAIRPGQAAGCCDLTDLDSVGLPVRWSGIAGDELRRYQALLPEPVLHALHGCAVEAILNATKHSGADHVTCDVRYEEDSLRVEISDDGRGFDRDLITERGIATSLLDRARTNGIDVLLDSTVGEGTRIRLAYRLGQATSSSDTNGIETVIAPLRDFTLRMAMAWGAHATITGLLIEVFSGRASSPLPFLLLGLLALLATVTWITCRHNRPAPVWLTGLLLAAVPTVNWCALAAVDYGHGTPYLFQAMSLTVLPVLLYVTAPTRRPFVSALILHVVSTLLIAWSVAGYDVTRWIDMLLLEAPAMALVTVYFVFLRVFRSTGVQIAGARRKAEQEARQTVVHEAVARVQRQWSASSLLAPFQLLQDISDGALSPADPETRRRCREEEDHLRQISVLSQDSSLMSWWFALALAESRRRSIRLYIHIGGADITVPEDADALGRLILDSISHAPPGTELTVSLLQHRSSPRLLIVGDRHGDLFESAQPMHARRTDRLTVNCQRLPGQMLIEATPT